jgi:hypothetical protein
MWKVKRMKPARIVVLTIAVGAGSMAARPAAGCGNMCLPASGAATDHRFLAAAGFHGLPALPLQVSAASGAREIALADALNITSALGRNTDVTERTPL